MNGRRDWRGGGEVYRECVLAVVPGAVVAYDDQVRLRCSGATIDAVLAQLLCSEGLHFSTYLITIQAAT